MARKFFYVCAGMLMLALSYHFGASTATAQAPGNPVVGIASAYGSGFTFGVATANGDIYTGDPVNGWRRGGNVFSGSGPTPALHESWGQVKARYRGNPVSTTPGTTDR